jgi:guanyl-specific ribonuclease Sa
MKQRILKYLVISLVAIGTLWISYFNNQRGEIHAGKGSAFATSLSPNSKTVIPNKVFEVINSIKPNGAPPAGYRGGTRYANDGRGSGQVLPQTDANGQPVTYKEYDVNPYQRGINRGVERVVIANTGEAYYTNDHYRNFTQVPLK